MDGVRLIEVVCRKYKVNPTWLILGSGAMFRNEEMSLEQRLEKIENEIKIKKA